MAKVVGASVKIKGGAGGNAGESTKILKSIDKSLGEMAGRITKESGLNLGGMFGLGGLLSKGGLIGAALGAAGGAALYHLDQGNSPLDKAAGAASPFYYEQVYDPDSGEFKIAEINKETQEISRIMTIAQAQMLGVADETGNLKKGFQTTNSVWDKVTEDSEKIGGYTVLSKDNMKDIADNLIDMGEYTGEQKLLMQNITYYLQLKEKRLRDEENKGKLPEGYLRADYQNEKEAEKQRQLLANVSTVDYGKQLLSGNADPRGIMQEQARRIEEGYMQRNPQAFGGAGISYSESQFSQNYGNTPYHELLDTMNNQMNRLRETVPATGPLLDFGNWLGRLF